LSKKVNLIHRVFFLKYPFPLYFNYIVRRKRRELSCNTSIFSLSELMKGLRDISIKTKTSKTFSLLTFYISCRWQLTNARNYININGRWLSPPPSSSRMTDWSQRQQWWGMINCTVTLSRECPNDLDDAKISIEWRKMTVIMRPRELMLL